MFDESLREREKGLKRLMKDYEREKEKEGLEGFYNFITLWCWGLGNGEGRFLAREHLCAE